MDDETNDGSEQVLSVAQPEVRRLVRRNDHKIFAGVTTGLGDYFGLDPVWFRLGFVVSSLLGGIGVVLYLVLWVVMPDERSAAPQPLERHAERIASSLRGTPSWVGIALVVVGGLLAVTQMVAWRPGVFWGIALVVLGILLFRRWEDAPPSSDIPATPQAPRVGDPTQPATTAVPSAIPGTPTSAPPLPSAAAPSSPRIKRERSRLGWFTTGALLLALGGAGVLDLADVLEITLVQYLALGLAVLGLGMVVGAWVGRARWLIVPCILLVPFVLTASLIEVPFAGGAGDRFIHPTSVQAIQREYHLIAGQIVLDLRDVVVGPRPVTIRVTAVAGKILVRVPEGTPLEVRARVGAGDVELFGRNYDGVKVDVRRRFFAGAPPGSPALILLDLETSLGAVEVTSLGEAVS